MDRANALPGKIDNKSHFKPLCSLHENAAMRYDGCVLMCKDLPSSLLIRVINKPYKIPSDFSIVSTVRLPHHETVFLHRNGNRRETSIKET